VGDTDDFRATRRKLLFAELPTSVGSRASEQRTGEMWASDSIISGIGPDATRLPPNGRAPGWHAGLVVARSAPVV
jgi:hypothetical protein